MFINLRSHSGMVPFPAHREELTDSKAPNADHSAERHSYNPEAYRLPQLEL